MSIFRIGSVSVLGCLTLVSCGSDTPTTPDATRPINIVSGANVADTVNARLLQALIVEVRQNGVLKPGTIVRFEALPSGNAQRPFDNSILISQLATNQFTTFVADSTDAAGRARVLVQLGTIAGSAGIAVSVPEFGVVDTAMYTVRAGGPARITLTVRDTAVSIGASYNLGAAASDRFGNARTDVPTFSALTPYVTVDAAGVVKATSAGRALITVTAGKFADTARASIIPDGTIVGATSASTIATAKLDGTGFKVLTGTTSIVMLPRFNPAGNRIVFYEGDPSFNSNLFLVDLIGTRTLVNVGAGPSSRFFPTFSADGQQLFFSGVSPATSSTEIWRSQLDGSGVTKMTSLANQVSTQPNASPDGTKVVFNRAGDIATLDLATMVVKSLGVRGAFPKYSPDGKQILFQGSTIGLSVMNADGTNIRSFTPQFYGTYSSPNWSPDGNWFIIEGQFSLQLVRVSNGEILPLLPLSGLGFTQVSFKP